MQTPSPLSRPEIARQDYWERLASFILSATKQIVQIQQMVALLAECYGKPIASGGARRRSLSRLIEQIAACPKLSFMTASWAFVRQTCSAPETSLTATSRATVT